MRLFRIFFSDEWFCNRVLQSKKNLPYYGLSFIGDFATFLLSVLFVFYGVTLNFSTTKIGIIIAAYGFSYALMPLVGGIFSDKISRRQSLLIATVGQIGSGFVFLAITWLTLAFDLSEQGIFIGLLSGQILRGIAYSFFWPAIEAGLSENTGHNPQLHKRTINLFCISWSLGLALGPLIAGMIPISAMLETFIVLIFMYCIALGIVISMIPRNPSPSVERHDPMVPISSQNGQNSPRSKTSSHDRGPIILLLASLVYAFIQKGFTSYFPNYAVLPFPTGLQWNTNLTGQLMFLSGIGQIIFFCIGKWIPTSLNTLRIGFTLQIGVCISFAYINFPSVNGIFLFFFGFLNGLIYFNSLELLLKSQTNQKGKFAGAFESMVGWGVAFAPFLMGIIAERNSVVPFWIMGGIALVPILFSWKFPVKRKKKIII